VSVCLCELSVCLVSVSVCCVCVCVYLCDVCLCMSSCAEGLEMALSELSGYVALFRLCQLGRGKGALGPAPAICDQRCGRLQARPGGRGSGLDAALAFLVSGREALIRVVLAWPAFPSVK